MTYKRSSMSPWKWWKCITIVLVTYSLLQSHPSHPWIIFLTFVSSIDYLQVLWLSIPTFVASVFIMQCLFDLPHLWWMMPIPHWEILALWLVAFFFSFISLGRCLSCKIHMQFSDSHGIFWVFIHLLSTIRMTEWMKTPWVELGALSNSRLPGVPDSQ